jgi:hypothetical protein
VCNFVKVVVDNFTKVNKHVLLNLNFSVLVNLDSGCVNNAQISNIILSVLANNHELRLPKLLVVWNLIVIGVTFSDFKDTRVTVEVNAKSFDFFSVDSLKLEVKFVGSSFVWNTFKRSALQIRGIMSFYVRVSSNLELRKILVFGKY